MNFGRKTLAKKKNAITIRIQEDKYEIFLPSGCYFLSIDVDDFSVELILKFPLINSTSSSWAFVALYIVEDGNVSVESDIDLYNSTDRAHIFGSNHVFPYLPMVGKIKLIKDIIIKDLDLFLENIPVNKLCMY